MSNVMLLIPNTNTCLLNMNQYNFPPHYLAFKSQDFLLSIFIYLFLLFSVVLVSGESKFTWLRWRNAFNKYSMKKNLYMYIISEQYAYIIIELRNCKTKIVLPLNVLFAHTCSVTRLSTLRKLFV